MAISLKRGEPEPLILNGSAIGRPPSVMGTLLIEIWGSIFCYLQKKYR